MMVQQIKATAGNRLTCQHNVSDIRICKKKKFNFYSTFVYWFRFLCLVLYKNLEFSYFSKNFLESSFVSDYH